MQIFFALLSIGFVLIAFADYLRDMWAGKTKPHVYTWLVWALTQSVAFAGIWKGNGGLGGLAVMIGGGLVFVVFLLSLKFGTKNITVHDTVVLILALLAIVVWVQLHQALLSVIMVTVIDMIGYIPSYRKSYVDPYSETLRTWILFSIANVFTILALESWNALTVTYLLALIAANMTLVSICVLRRRVIALRR